METARKVYTRSRLILLLLICIVLFIVTSCTGRGAVMTSDRFADIALGTPVDTIEKDFGPPFTVKSAGHQHVYEYIERIYMGTQVIGMRRYYLIIADKKVVGKYVRFSNPPPYEAIYSDDIYQE